MQTTNNNDADFRAYNATDTLVEFIDTSLRTIFGTPITTNRIYPALNTVSHTLNHNDSQHSAGLMRVNHTGEVCAQALYQGQALTARDPAIRIKFKQAALEENDHLAWCQTRLTELNSQPSYLNPLWYLGSLSIGIIAGFCGDKWNLGFLAETEQQVSQHLASHLQKLPHEDFRSKAIVAQMKVDEEQHATTAIEYGAYTLPAVIKYTMQMSAKVMTTLAYYI
jgi:ubiquinone biosynthesis monooxygenase Coq7